MLRMNVYIQHVNQVRYINMAVVYTNDQLCTRIHLSVIEKNMI